LLEEGSVVADCCFRCDPECSFEVGVARSSAHMASFACGFVLPGAYSRPGSQMRCGVEPAHVGPYFCQDVLCSHGSDSWDSCDERARPIDIVGGDRLGARWREVLGVSVELIDPVQVHSGEHSVMGGKVSLEC